MNPTVYTISEECEHSRELGKCGQCQKAMKDNLQEFESFEELNKSLIQNDDAWGKLIAVQEYHQMYRGKGKAE